MSFKRAQLVAAGRAQVVGGGDDIDTAGYYGSGAAPMVPHRPMPPGHHPGHHHGHPHHPHWPYPGPVSYAIPGAPSVAYDRGPGRIGIVDEAPVHERQFPIGFVTPVGENVPANSTALLTAQPQVVFRGERLAVPNSIVLNFQLVDIKVGKDSQLAAPGNMPTECFSNISIGVRMQLDTAEPGITLTLVPQNTDAANTHPFSSVLYGTVIE
jgi:hypothetical protein